MFFKSGSSAGVVGLGESNRGAQLLLAYAALGVFVTFSRTRSIWRLVFVACAAIPVILLCNFLRFLCWGIVAVYVTTDPASSVCRSISAAISIPVAYILFVLAGSVGTHLFVDVDEGAEVQEDAHG